MEGLHGIPSILIRIKANGVMTREAIAAQKIILHNIEHHLNQFSLGDKKVSLLGFSQGAILGWAVGLSHPDKIDKVVALSGYVNEDLFDFASQGLQ